MSFYGRINSLFKRLIPIAVLYGGRIGIAALGLIILPWLSNVMPAEEFGLAATVISLQSLAIVLDLGLSITIARELPATESPNERRYVVRRCEQVLISLYLAITVIAAGLSFLGLIPVPVPTVLIICLSMLIVVWQNLVVVAFIARQRFITSTVSQFLSLLLRLGTALACVTFYDGTLQVFVLGQVIGSAIGLIISRLAVSWQNRPDRYAVANSRSLFASNLAITVYTIAGASAMQLDKVLLSALASPSYTGAYFLASIFSLVPITFLASPLSQFVQPKLIASIALHREAEAGRWIVRLTGAIILLAVLPGMVIAFGARLIIPLWLQGAAQQAEVIRYAELLMPGASIGALGLVPAIVLIARKDYRALATISCSLAAGVLILTALFASKNAVDEICFAYAAYHVLAAIALWWRAWRIEPIFANSFRFPIRGAKGRP